MFFIGMAGSYCLSVLALMFYIPKGGIIRLRELSAICFSIFGGFFLLLLLNQSSYSRKSLIISLAVLAGFVILSLTLKNTLQKPLLYIVSLVVGVAVAGLANGTRPTELIGLSDASSRHAQSESRTEHKLVRTSLYKLVATYHRNIMVEEVTGGALSVFGDQYLLATGDGQLYSFSWNAEKKTLKSKKLPYRVPLNREEFIRDSAHNSKKVNTRFFRTADILVQDLGKEFRLFVSHHHWNSEKQCFTVRVSAARGNYAKFVSGEDAPIWETIYESSPCLGFKNKGDAFAGFQIGGKMVLLDNRSLLLAVGDHMFDGVDSDEILPQDKRAAYGKTILINLETHTSSIYSLGHRNPQGLDVDLQKNIWETEHGPKGGDELNLIAKGKNYGWPLVTYGTNYTEAIWPLSASQGKHEGYERPTYAWIPSIGISALATSKSPLFKLWNHDLLVGSLAAKALWRVRIEQGRAVFAERIPIGERIRDIIEDRDGRLILWTEALIEAPTQTTIVIIEPFVEGDGKLLEGLTSVERGELAFDRCDGCHNLRDGTVHGIGPDLQGVFDRRIASAKDYNYSQALKSVSGKWTEQNLEAFLKDPNKFAPGTSMQIPPIQDSKDRANLIEYLKTQTQSSIH